MNLTRVSKLMTAALMLAGMAVNAQDRDFVAHDFNDGDIEPFEVCTTKNPNYARVINNRMVTYWTESGYDGGRVSKGAEFCFPAFVSLKETWMGWTMNIDPGHRNDSESGVMQIFQFVDNQNIFTWTGMLLYKYGDLEVVHRSGKNEASKVYGTVMADAPRGEDINIIAHYVLSGQGNGLIEFWINGVQTYTVYDINFGFGSWDNDVQYDDTYVELKLGQYDYQHETYNANEERIIYYDNVTWYNGGAEGYDVVDPDPNGEGPVTPECASFDAFEKIEAEDYCSHSGIQTEASEDDDTDNVGYINDGDWMMYENVDLSNASSIAARVASNFAGGTIEVRLDEASGELLTSIEVENTGGNQSWITLENNIDDVSGTHDVYLVFTGGDGYLFNLNWFQFSAETLSSTSVEKLSNLIDIYPNPVSETLNVDLKENAQSGIITVFDAKGQLVHKVTKGNATQSVDLSTLANGLYFVKIAVGSSTTVKSILKK